ncbi:MAG: AtpZ/AtpI family protein [Parcubacteria group bacterium]|jgi:F0F1-type ATP synthase assembly protein I
MEDNKKKPEVVWWQPAIVMFSRLSGWIIGPIIIALFVGKWLDKKYGTDPWLFLGSVGIAFVISTFGIIMDARKELRRIDREEKSKKDFKK